MLKNITYIKSGLLIGIILCWSLSLNGQTPYFKTIIFNRENPNLKINTIFKDHEGFLYIGTSEGVYKSDGIDEVLYQSNRGADEVLSIAEDETGTIWVGCRFGKVYTISSGVISIPFRKKISENNITSICTLKDSSVLIGTGGDGILQYKKIGRAHV